MWYIIVLLTGLLMTGTVGAAGQVGADRKLGELKQDTRVFEKIINEVLRQKFSNPFAIAAGPQAAYLPGYGVVVTFYLKISRGTIRGFQKEIPIEPESATRSRADQIDMVQEIMRQSLGDYGSTLKNLGNAESVAVCAIVEDRNELDPSRSRTDLVISSSKENIDLFSTKRIDREEFNRRLNWVEY